MKMKTKTKTDATTTAQSQELKELKDDRNAKTWHRVISLSSTRAIHEQPDPPTNPPTIAIFWSAEKNLGHITSSTQTRMTLQSMCEHLKAFPPVIVLVHDRNTLHKDLVDLLGHALVIDTYQFAKEFLPGKKNYALRALVPEERARAASTKTRLLAEDMNLVQLIFQISLMTGQPCSKVLSKMGRIEWMLARKFLELGCIPPDKPFRCEREPYQGGKVLEPRRGLYTNNILYFDFRSLYPSVCVENNICYSEDGRILPPLMKHLIETRKNLEEAAKHSSSIAIRRVCIKLLSNSIYGCLASKYSRFYSIELAKAITLAGRDALTATERLIKRKFNLDAIYGDTDSLMILLPATFTDKSALAPLAQRIIDYINKRYFYMELQFEGVIEKLALFSKKCYACLKNGVFELKGLDMIKRGYAPCGINVCHWIIDAMFENLTQNTETLRAIYKYTNEVVFPTINGASLPLTDFVITTQLSKDPSKYTTTAGMHHMQAIARQRVSFKRGDFVHYIMTTPRGAVLVNPTDTSTSLDLDVRWYLSHITGMVDRLLSIYPAHKIANVFRDSAAESNYLSFLPPPFTPQISKMGTEHLKLREKLIFSCPHCEYSEAYLGFIPLEEYLVAREKRSGAHIHVDKQDILSALPDNLRQCGTCIETIDLAKFQETLGDSHQYSFSLNTDTYRICKQVSCHHCQTIIWDTLRNARIVEFFSPPLPIYDDDF